MKPLQDLSDDEIDTLLLDLFNGGAPVHPVTVQRPTRRIEDLSQEELLRIRSRNHPDKWPNVNQAAYQAAVEELHRRRQITKRLNQ
ncbi:hypothetical protein [Flavobacterium sp.]|jgi:hypothetical protein|uniref:hypothetical protein n=1 Tax=Flavobacterium sp. TaxID=239 RepID=UPI0037BE4878